jgi:hypothetical protein
MRDVCRKSISILALIISGCSRHPSIAYEYIPSNGKVPNPTCSISAIVDSIIEIPKSQKRTEVDIYWHAEGYSDSCYSQKMICVDWLCHSVIHRSKGNDGDFVTPVASEHINIYGDDSLIIIRNGYISTIDPIWEKINGNFIVRGERFVKISGKIDSVSIKYSPYGNARIKNIQLQ